MYGEDEPPQRADIDDAELSQALLHVANAQLADASPYSPPASPALASALQLPLGMMVADEEQSPRLGRRGSLASRRGSLAASLAAGSRRGSQAGLSGAADGLQMPSEELDLEAVRRKVVLVVDVAQALRNERKALKNMLKRVLRKIQSIPIVIADYRASRSLFIDFLEPDSPSPGSPRSPPSVAARKRPQKAGRLAAANMPLSPLSPRVLGSLSPGSPRSPQLSPHAQRSQIWDPNSPSAPAPRAQRDASWAPGAQRDASWGSPRSPRSPPFQRNTSWGTNASQQEERVQIVSPKEIVLQSPPRRRGTRVSEESEELIVTIVFVTITTITVIIIIIITTISYHIML